MVNNVDCFEPIKEGIWFKCPACGKKGVLYITHTEGCVNDGKRICGLRPANPLPIQDAPALPIHANPGWGPRINIDTTEINLGDEIKGECWSHKGKYMGKLLETKLVGRMFDEDLQCKFENGTLKDIRIKCTPVPCQNGGKRRRSHKRTRKHMKRRKQSTRKH